MEKMAGIVLSEVDIKLKPGNDIESLCIHALKVMIYSKIQKNAVHSVA